MSKIVLSKPALIFLYGFPGSGKSYLARHLAESINLVQVSADRIRNELFEHPRYDDQENAIIMHLMNYMTEEFLDAGIGVVYDMNATRFSHRKALRTLAEQHKAASLLIWVQIDSESAFARTQGRDRRTFDDKYAAPQTRQTYDQQLSVMQNPTEDEACLVISGKHHFATQKGAVLNRLYQLGLTSSNVVQNNVAVPGLINLVPNPNAGRVDLSRRNINIG